jgi:hypothetical protein
MVDAAPSTACRTWQSIASNSLALSLNAMISVGHTKVKSCSRTAIQSALCLEPANKFVGGYRGYCVMLGREGRHSLWYGTVTAEPTAMWALRSGCAVPHAHSLLLRLVAASAYASASGSTVAAAAAAHLGVPEEHNVFAPVV